MSILSTQVEFINSTTGILPPSLGLTINLFGNGGGGAGATILDTTSSGGGGGGSGEQKLATFPANKESLFINLIMGSPGFGGKSGLQGQNGGDGDPIVLEIYDYNMKCQKPGRLLTTFTAYGGKAGKAGVSAFIGGAGGNGYYPAGGGGGLEIGGVGGSSLTFPNIRGENGENINYILFGGSGYNNMGSGAQGDISTNPFHRVGGGGGGGGNEGGDGGGFGFIATTGGIGAGHGGGGGGGLGITFPGGADGAPGAPGSVLIFYTPLLCKDGCKKKKHCYKR